MNFDDYQRIAHKTAVFPKLGKSFVYPTLGLAGEAGEVSEKVKKIFRDKKGRLSKETREEIKKELGDVLWYLSQIAYEMKISFQDIAKSNIQKLSSRNKRGTIRGDGDNR